MATPASVTNSDCVQATPLVQSALREVNQLQRRAVTATEARPSLVSEVTALMRLARATPDSVLQETLANVYGAFTAFQAVMQNPNASAYPDTFFNLLGILSGFQRTCSVVDSDLLNGTSGAGPSLNTRLSRSAIAYNAPWSLQVANAGVNHATAGFTYALSSVSPTLRGSEQIGLWARALAGTATVTLQVGELVGDTVLGTRQVTMKLNSTFRFESLTYRVRRPGASTLSVTISATDLATGQAFLVDDITIVRD
jgi:hypothetical protein